MVLIAKQKDWKNTEEKYMIQKVGKRGCQCDGVQVYVMLCVWLMTVSFITT